MSKRKKILLCSLLIIIGSYNLIALGESEQKETITPEIQTEQITYAIGDVGEAGGIIFYIDENTVYYECSPYLGEGNWEEAKKMAENYNGGGYDDWILPTKEDLELMHTELLKSGYIKERNFLWSVTDYTNGKAPWVYDFESGKPATAFPTRIYGLRAVRSFTVSEHSLVKNAVKLQPLSTDELRSLKEKAQNETQIIAKQNTLTFQTFDKGIEQLFEPLRENEVIAYENRRYTNSQTKIHIYAKNTEGERRELCVLDGYSEHNLDQIVDKDRTIGFLYYTVVSVTESTDKRKHQLVYYIDALTGTKELVVDLKAYTSEDVFTTWKHSPDGKYIVIAGTPNIVLFDVQKKEVVEEYEWVIEALKEIKNEDFILTAILFDTDSFLFSYNGEFANAHGFAELNPYTRDFTVLEEYPDFKPVRYTEYLKTKE